MKLETFELPTFWASALINGDTSGLSDEDEKALDAFTDWMVKEYGSCHCLDVQGDGDNFRWRHDATSFGVLACNVADFVFDVEKR